MKKLLTMIMSLVLCLSLSIPALATDNDTSGDINASYDVCLYVDDTGEALSVELTACTAVTDGVITVTYDAETVSIAEEDVVPSDVVDMYSVNASEEGTLKISWISAEPAEGTLFTLGFVQLDGATVTTGTFTLTGSVVDEDNNDMTLGIETNAVSGGDEGDEGNSVDKTALQALYNNGLTLNEDNYTADSWATFEAAMADALAVLENEDATQEEVDTALAALAEAMQNLVLADTGKETETDKSELQNLYDASLLLTESDYTADSWADLVAAQEAALAVLENEEATQEEIDAARDALLNAIQALENVSEEINMDALLLMYEASLKLNEEDYTEDSWADLVAAQEAALAVLENEDATQEEVDAALADLIAALQGLVQVSGEESVDKSALEAAYEASLELKEDNYTEDSWADLVAAQEAASAVLEDEDATQEEIDAALAALLSAIQALETSTTSSGGSATGDNAPVYFLLLAAAMAAAVAVFLATMKKRNVKR